MTKKKEQLGMSHSTASHRLIKDIIFGFICETGINKCFQCGEPMTRENYSIEHKVPWLDSENPVELFFNLSNISYSHLSCNVRASRDGRKLPDGEARRRELQRHVDYKKKNYSKEKRREQYLRTGK